LGFRSYWGEYYDRDLNLLLPEAPGTRYAVLPRSGWDGAGNPVYRWKDLRLLFDDFQLAAEGEVEQGFGAVAVGDDGSCYRTECYGPPLPGGVDHAADHSFAKLARFRPDGKGGFVPAWRVGRKARGIATSGEMYVPSQVSEPIHGIVGVHDLNGTFHLFTTDGLYLDTILSDIYSHGPPQTAYDLDGEMFGGRMFYNKGDGQAYLLQGHKAITVFRIENLTSDGVVRPIANTSGPMALAAAQIAPASAAALQRRGARRLIEVMPAGGAPPALDGAPSGWSQARPATFSPGEGRSVEARVLYDRGHLYVRCEVRTGGPPNTTTAGNLLRCFTHDAGADVVSLYVQGDCLSNPTRTTPAWGDVRFLLAPISQPGGKPKAAVVALYGVYPGGRAPVTYSSPVGKVTFEEVRVLGDARSGCRVHPDARGFTIAAAIPLAAIPALEPRAGLVTGIDFDAVFAGKVRSWWSNTPANPTASLMSDEFSEARVYPEIWGQAQFGDPSRLTLTQWSVVGPFGGAELVRDGANPQYVLEKLAAMQYPPEQRIDLKAKYQGDLTRTWRGEPREIAWQQVEADAGGWVRFDRVLALSGDDSRGTAFAVAWVYAPTAAKVKLDVEAAGICYAQQLWLNGRPLKREPATERGPRQFRITSGQDVELSAGWNRFVLRADSWAHTWLFEQHGGWAFRLTLHGPERDLWRFRVASTDPCETRSAPL
jgi:hypothetical protein